MENLNEISLVMMSEEELAEFYNQCHGPDGKFCPGGSGGSSSGGVSGKARLDDDAYMNVYPSSQVPSSYGWGNDHARDFPALGYGSYLSRQHLTDDAHNNLNYNSNFDKNTHEQYTGTLYHRVNDYLRNDRDNTLPEKRGLSLDYLHYNDTEDYVQSLDRTFSRSSIPVHNTTLFRGMDATKYDDLSPGSVLRDKGYLSTSVKPDVAKPFGDWFKEQKGALVMIRTGDNTRGLAGTKREEEIILNRGTGLRVNTIASDLATRQLIIDASVVE